MKYTILITAIICTTITILLINTNALKPVYMIHHNCGETQYIIKGSHEGYKKAIQELQFQYHYPHGTLPPNWDKDWLLYYRTEEKK